MDSIQAEIYRLKNRLMCILVREVDLHNLLNQFQEDGFAAHSFLANIAYGVDTDIMIQCNHPRWYWYDTGRTIDIIRWYRHE